MPLFIKTERFTSSTIKLLPSIRAKYLTNHKNWVKELRKAGKNLTSGYLVNKNHEPGGGGFLVIEATSFDEAKCIIKEDPMIKNNLVAWDLHEWVPVAGKLLSSKDQRG